VNYLLDTAPWINSVKEPAALPARIRRLLSDPAEVFGLADISLWEVATLSAKGRVDLGLPLCDWFQRAIAANLQVLPIDAETATVVHDLPAGFHGDPADRLIVATAVVHRLTLITADTAIRDAGLVPTIFYPWRPIRA
jgi:PIN domain nuclease of toxin-antitoxin system